MLWSLNTLLDTRYVINMICGRSVNDLFHLIFFFLGISFGGFLLPLHPSGPLGWYNCHLHRPGQNHITRHLNVF